MGQCYTVATNLKFKGGNPAGFCEVIRSEIEARNGITAYFRSDINELDLQDPYDCFRAMTARNAYKWDDGRWVADFNASYGWGNLMEKVFAHAAEELEDGSVISIGYWEGGDGDTVIKVEDGKVIVRL